MNSSYGAPVYGGNTMGYTTVETLLEDVSGQMASSNLTRYSRGSNGQRATGGSMRIVKPSSTSNSPRGSIGLGRRRTVVTDRRRSAMADPNLMALGGFISNDGLQATPKSARPFSWHPSSQMAPQPQYQSAYQVPTFNTQSDFDIFDLPPTPAVYSQYGSPDSAFSPLSMPYTGYQQSYPFADTSIPYHSDQVYVSDQSYMQAATTSYSATQPGNTNSSMCSHFDWSSFPTKNFEGSTAPPTPDNFLPIQYPDTVLPADEAIPFHSLSDDESQGEILQGLGLYDTPEISKPPPSDPHFDNYRAIVMSQLLGPSHRKTESESTGTGLKLEETWNPPPSDDEDDEEDDDDDDADDDEQDGEGEDDDEPVAVIANDLAAKEAFTLRSNGLIDATNFIPTSMHANQDFQSSSSWL